MSEFKALEVVSIASASSECAVNITMITTPLSILTFACKGSFKLAQQSRPCILLEEAYFPVLKAAHSHKDWCAILVMYVFEVCL